MHMYKLARGRDRPGVTMHPAQPDWTFDEKVKV